MVSVVLLTVLLGWLQSGQEDNGPLLSATNPTYLSCIAWTGKAWSQPTARSARTPVKLSSKGYRAYGEVTAAVHGEDCENTTTLYVAGPTAKDFKKVYTTSDDEGNGIRLVAWSPGGDRLLTEVTFWRYNSDAGLGYLPVIYDASTNSAQEIHALDKALIKLFGSECGFEDHVISWRTGGQLLVRVSPPRATEDDEEYLCVKQPRLYSYDLQKDNLKAI